jgi:glycosyltransferase involved in cell wall biosynthesis
MAKILWDIHAYPPYQNAGAEWMAKEINDYLFNNGHDILVKTPFKSNTQEGVTYHRIFQDPNQYNNVYHPLWADVIFTHLDMSQSVTNNFCNEKPVFNVVHHNWEIPHLRESRKNVRVVYNSHWVYADRNYPHDSVVVRPPVNPERFKDVKYNPNGYITLVNCNKDKGALIFQQIARMCPDLKFLAVKGAHGPQIELKGKNITQWEVQDDIRNVLEQTSILLVPSVYESYGRIAIEAMACGIPVIASDTPGLRESMGLCGTFTSRNHIPAWLHCIRTTPRHYRHAYNVHANTLWNNSLIELDALNNLILKSIKK